MVDTQLAPAAAPGSAAHLWSRFRAALVRSSDERIIAGLASGLAARLRVGSAYIRAGFVVLALAGGAGVVLYGLGWALAVATEPTREISRDLPERQRAGLGLMFLAGVFALRGIGFWFGDAVVWSSVLIAFGIAAIWDHTGSQEATGSILAETAPGKVRIAFGGILMLAGLATFSGSLEAMQQLGPVVVAIGITAAGFMLVFGPWVVRLAGDLASERRDRIRSEERSEVAAHLHDSVLQTLALIQRTDDPRKMVTLARSQERELRTWLYSSDRAADGEMLSRALEAAATRVEQAHDVPVEVVVVNDVPVTNGVDAVVKAATEAMNNAAKHSSAGRVSVYAEAVGGSLDVFVTDQGGGFDPRVVPDDRHGIRESIVGRMQRHGGNATIHSEAGEGTEVHLEMPLEVS